MAKVRIYGKVVNEWYSEDEKWGKILTQKEVEYTDYDTETGTVRATGTEDFSRERWNREVKNSWVYTWDGQKLNKGGHRWFEDQGAIKYRASEKKAVKTMLQAKYSEASLIQLR